MRTWTRRLYIAAAAVLCVAAGREAWASGGAETNTVSDSAYELYFAESADPVCVNCRVRFEAVLTCKDPRGPAYEMVTIRVDPGTIVDWMPGAVVNADTTEVSHAYSVWVEASSPTPGSDAIWAVASAVGLTNGPFKTDVVKVEVTNAFDHVCTNEPAHASHVVGLDLIPCGFGAIVDLAIRTNGTGDAVFETTGTHDEDIAADAALTILGRAVSTNLNDLILEASLNGCVCTSRAFTAVDVVKETGTEFLHTVNTTNDVTQADDINKVWICQTSNDTATLSLGLSWLPSGYSASEFRWDAVLTNGTAAGEWGGPGTFENNPSNITWTPGNPTNREFRIRSWFDCDGDDAYSGSEPHRIIDVTVVDLDKLQATYASSNVTDTTRFNEPLGSATTLRIATDSTGSVMIAHTLSWSPASCPASRMHWQLTRTDDVVSAQWSPSSGTYSTSAAATFSPTVDTNGKTNWLFKLTAWYDCDGNNALDSDEPQRSVYVGLAWLTVNRDADCTLRLDDWPVAGTKPRSPKWMFGSNDFIYVRLRASVALVGPNPHVAVKSVSDTTGIDIGLSMVSADDFRNIDGTGELLGLGDASAEAAVDRIKTVDEEVLTFTYAMPSGPTLSYDAMVDRFELLRIAGSDEGILGVAPTCNSCLSTIGASFATATMVPWNNGVMNGNNYVLSGSAADVTYEQGKRDALIRAYDTAVAASQSDLVCLDGHGYSDGRFSFIGSDKIYAGSPPVCYPQTWPCPLNGSLSWVNEVEWFADRSCNAFGIGGPGDPPQPGLNAGADRWKGLLNGSAPDLHAMLGQWRPTWTNPSLWSRFVCQLSNGHTVRTAWKIAQMSTGADYYYGLLVRTGNEFDYIQKPCLPAARPVSQDNPGAALAYEYMSPSSSAPGWWGTYVTELDHDVFRREVLTNLLYAGTTNVATWAVVTGSTSLWCCVTNITGESLDGEETHDYLWTCDPETEASSSTSAVQVSSETCLAQTLADLHDVPSNGWIMTGTGSEVLESENGSVTNGFVMTWQHTVTNGCYLLNDFVRIGVRQQGYLFVRVAATEVALDGSVSIDILGLDAAFPDPKPSIELHYIRKGTFIRPVWLVSGKKGKVLIDAIAKEEFVADD